MSEYKLTSKILNISESDIWDSAKLEWELSKIYFAEIPQRCLCGHFPILEICILENKLNHQKATVGNCCVKKFIELPSDKIFQAVKRIRLDEDKALSIEAIEYAYSNSWISPRDYEFYTDTIRKRWTTMSKPQIYWRRRINAKVLSKMCLNR